MLLVSARQPDPRILGFTQQPDPISYGLTAGQHYLRILNVSPQLDPKLLGVAEPFNPIVLPARLNDIGLNFVARSKNIENIFFLN